MTAKCPLGRYEYFWGVAECAHALNAFSPFPAVFCTCVLWSQMLRMYGAWTMGNVTATWQWKSLVSHFDATVPTGASWAKFISHKCPSSLGLLNIIWIFRTDQQQWRATMPMVPPVRSAPYEQRAGLIQFSIRGEWKIMVENGESVHAWLKMVDSGQSFLVVDYTHTHTPTVINNKGIQRISASFSLR